MGRRGESPKASHWRNVQGSEGILNQQKKEQQGLIGALICTLHQFFDVLGDVRAEIALRWQWAKVADIFEEQVVEPLGPFQWETYWEKKLIVLHVLHERPLLPRVFVALSYTLLQMQLLRENRPELNRMTRRTLRHQMLPYGNHIIVYADQYFGFFDLPEYTEIIMGILEPAKSKLLKKIRRLRRDFIGSMKHPRAP